MRKSFTTEIVLMSVVGMAGALISKLTLITVISGTIMICLTSYFLVSKLKEDTINEYEEIKSKTSPKKKG